MKNVIIILFFLVAANGFCQSYDELQINNIRAGVRSNGLMFNDPLGDPSFEFPAGSGLHTMFASGLWLSGYKNGDSLYTSAQLYGWNNDFQPGPVMDTQYYASQAAVWNRVWKISLADVYDHAANYTNPGYIAPASILDWPGNGNTLLGQNAVLAPYYDYNGNGIYDPMNGDYPKIYGDECIFFMFNDETPHALTGSPSMGVEVHGMLYEIACFQDSASMNTVFLNLKIYNRRNNAFANCFVSLFNDTDVGCSNDDFVATDAFRGSVYAYNGYPIDSACAGSAGYDTLIPHQSIVMLAGPMMDSDGIDNPLTQNITDALDSLGIPYPYSGIGFGDSITDNERKGMTHSGYYYRSDVAPHPAMGEPLFSSDFRNYQAGLWMDSTSFYFGGTGHQSSGGAQTNGLVECDHIFPGYSDPLLWGVRGVPVANVYWDEISEGNTPADRRILISNGPFTFLPGEMKEIDVVYIGSKSYISSANFIPDTLRMLYTDQVHYMFRQNLSPCGLPLHYNMLPFTSGISSSENEVNFSLYPNPATHTVTVRMPSPGNYRIAMQNCLGEEVKNESFHSAISLRVQDLNSGIYFICVSRDDKPGSAVKKLMIIK